MTAWRASASPSSIAPVQLVGQHASPPRRGPASPTGGRPSAWRARGPGPARRAARGTGEPVPRAPPARPRRPGAPRARCSRCAGRRAWSATPLRWPARGSRRTQPEQVTARDLEGVDAGIEDGVELGERGDDQAEGQVRVADRSIALPEAVPHDRGRHRQRGPAELDDGAERRRRHVHGRPAARPRGAHDELGQPVAHRLDDRDHHDRR